MPKIAVLTCDEVSQYKCIDDDLFIEILEKEHHISVDQISWDKNRNWKEYDLVVIRTTWDYMDRADEFIQKLELISSQTKLINPIETVKWNYNKKYLLEIEKMGFTIIPTLLKSQISKEEIRELTKQQVYKKGLIIKPTIGASALGIQMIKNVDDLKEITAGEWFIQPFQKSIQTNGEFSLFVINGKYSHGINKLPKAGEFRSQEEYGSQITPYSASSELKQKCIDIVTSLPVPADYARIDLVLNESNEFQIIELELIEPCLFLKYDKLAPLNFANLILKKLSI